VCGAVVDELELRVPVFVLGTFDGLVCRLKAVAQLAEQPRHGSLSHGLAARLGQRDSEVSRALASPAQW